MSEYARTVGPQVSTQIQGLRDTVLLEGAMAAGALVALADQKLSVSESIAIQTVLANAKLLQIYDLELAMSLYTQHIDELRRDFAKGRETALDAVALCAEDIEAAELIVQVGIAIAKADEIFAESELEMIQMICARIGIEGLDTLGLADSVSTRMN